MTQPSSRWREANRFKRLQIACHVLQINTVFFACLPYFSPIQLPHLLYWSPAGTSVTSRRSFSSKALHSFARNARCSRHLIETLTPMTYQPAHVHLSEAHVIAYAYRMHAKYSVRTSELRHCFRGLPLWLVVEEVGGGGSG